MTPLGAEAWWKMNGSGAYSGYDGWNKLDEVSGAACAAWQIVGENPALYTGDNIKTGFCNIYRSDAGTWALTPNRIKTGLNADSVWTLQNTYTGGDISDPVICSGQTLVTKGTVVLD